MELSDLEKRVQYLEGRLAQLEKKLASPIPGDTSSAHESELLNKSDQPRSWDDLAPITPTYQEIKDENPLSQDITDKPTKSGNWLGIIAIICFVFAAGFIIKLSVETGWLTPTKQIIIADLLGILLITAGFFLLNTYRDYASLLPASGIIILYLAVFAGYRFYELTSFNTALIMTNCVSIFCIVLYRQFRHDIYPIVAAIGTYLAPIILNMHYASFFTIYYFLSCSLAFAVISIWVSSRMLTILSAYLAILATFLIGLNLNQNPMIAIALAANFMIFSISTYFYSICNNQQLTEYEAWTFFPVLMLFYALEYYLINSIDPNLAPWISLLFVFALIGLYLLTKQCFPNQQIKSQSPLYAFSAIVFFHSVYLELIPIQFKPWLFVILLLSLAFLPKKYLTEGKNPAFYTPILVLAVILMMEYFNIIYQLVTVNSHSILLVSAVAFISIWLVINKYRYDVYKKEEYAITILISAHILAIVGLYRLADDYGSLAVTSCWLLYAIIIMGIAYHHRDKFMAHSALLVLGLSAGKALLYDASMTPTAVRILCLLLTGVVLYGAGFVMKRISEWSK